MGNGALPHGPSYRAHPRLYRSVSAAMSAITPLLEYQQKYTLSPDFSWSSSAASARIHHDHGVVMDRPRKGFLKLLRPCLAGSDLGKPE